MRVLRSASSALRRSVTSLIPIVTSGWARTLSGHGFRRSPGGLTLQTMKLPSSCRYKSGTVRGCPGRRPIAVSNSTGFPVSVTRPLVVRMTQRWNGEIKPPITLTPTRVPPSLLNTPMPSSFHCSNRPRRLSGASRCARDGDQDRAQSQPAASPSRRLPDRTAMTHGRLRGRRSAKSQTRAPSPVHLLLSLPPRSPKGRHPASAAPRIRRYGDCALRGTTAGGRPQSGAHPPESASTRVSIVV